VQLSQIILFVHDAARMQAFYAQLGLVVVDGDAADGFVRMRDPAGGAVLALHFTKAIGPRTGPRVDTAIKPCFQVDDVDAARAALDGSGATMREIHRFDGIAICDGVDPEGNIFQVTTRS
jgi:catechol 2,3-dioxygenase-like lactoylglutathione lyase family enzyme